MFSKIPVTLKVLFGFLIALIGIGYFLVSTYKAANESIRESSVINYHIELITKLEYFITDIQDIETGNRGYVITLDEDYLEPFYIGKQKAEVHLLELEKMTENDSFVRPKIDSLRELAEQKILFAEKVISNTRNSNVVEGKNVILTGEGKKIMDTIRDIVMRIEDDSRSMLDRSTTERKTTIWRTRFKFLWLSSIILVTLVIFYSIIQRDLNRNEKAKNDMRLAEARIRSLYDHAPSGYVTVDKDLNIIQVNKTALRWLGMKAEEVEGKKNLSELVAPSSKEILKKVSENETIANLEIELVGNGNVSDVLLESVTMLDESDNSSEKRISLTDITKWKKAEEEIRYLARLMDQTSDAIYSVDTNLCIRSWNHGAVKMYGFTAEEAMNKNLSIFRSKSTDEERKIILSELMEKGKWSGEFTHITKEGKEIYVINSIATVKDENQQLTGYVCVVQDITHRKLYEEKLENFNQELLKKVNEKTREIINLLERVTDGFLSLDKEFKVTYINEIGATMMGTTKDFLLGKDLTKAFSPDDNSFRRAYKRAFKEQIRIELEDYLPALKKWYYGVAYPSPEGISVFFRDVTKRRESEIKLVESEKQYRHLFEHNPLPMWVLDLETMTIIDINKSAVKLYGYSPIEFIGKKMIDLFAPEEMKRFSEFKKIKSGEVVDAGVWKHLTNTGEVIQVEILCYDTKYTESPSMLVISHDITDKMRYEEELKQSRDQLRQLSIHSEKVREEERAHIAREIHDELGQMLTGLKMDLSWLSKRIDMNVPGAKEKITEMLGIVDDTVKSIRKIASELRPGMLDDLGLNAAIDWQTHEFEKRSGISCTYDSNVKDQKFDKNISIGVFRILQEALTNVARHSNATLVSCELFAENNELRLSIKDNGKGIVMAEPKNKTLGLLGMRERALMMNGNLLIESQIGKGTNVSLVVPLNTNLN